MSLLNIAILGPQSSASRETSPGQHSIGLAVGRSMCHATSLRHRWWSRCAVAGYPAGRNVRYQNMSVFHVNKCSQSSITPPSRLALWRPLSECLQVQLLPLIYRNKREGLVFPGVAVTLACFHFTIPISVYPTWSMLNIPEDSNASNAEVMLLTSSLFFKRIHKPKKLQHAPSAATPQHSANEAANQLQDALRGRL